MKKIKFIGGIIMAISMSTLIACGNTKEKAANKIVEELNNRYNKSFVVDSIGNSWGTADNSTIKAWCYEEGNKEEMFKAEIKKDFSEVKDEYQVLIIEKELEKEITQTLQPVLEEIFVDVYLGNVMTADNTEYTDYSEYFKDNNYAALSMEIYVKTKSDINKEVEANRISEVLNLYSKLNYNTSIITLFYVKEDIFNNIDSEYKSLKDNASYYRTNENSYNYVWLDFRKKSDLYLESKEILDAFKW